MTNKKKMRTTIISILMLASLAVSSYAYRVDYVSGTLCDSIGADGGLYITESTNSYGAMADTTIDSNSYQRTLSVSVTLVPYNDTLYDPVSDSLSKTSTSRIAVDTALVSTTNAKSASGNHSVTLYKSNTSYHVWSDSTSWQKTKD